MTRLASTPFYADGTVIATWGGWGVLGAQVPATGTDGPALTYPSLSLPADAASEVRMELITLPASGTFTYYDDTSATLVGASNGAWTASFRVFVAEVDRSIATAYFYVGGAVAQLLGALDGIVGDLLAGSPRAEAQFAGTLDSIGGNVLAGTFSFGAPKRRITLNPPLGTVGGKQLGDAQSQ